MAKREVKIALGSLKELLSGDDDFVRDAVRGYLQDVLEEEMTAAVGAGKGERSVALLVSGRIHDAVRRGSGNFLHGHTFMGHALACAAALAVQHQIHERNLLANAGRQGKILSEALRARFGNHPHVGDVRGRGLMQCIELVADRGTKEPFDPACGCPFAH